MKSIVPFVSGLALTGAVAGAFSFQRPVAFGGKDGQSLLNQAIDALGLDRNDVLGSISDELKTVWDEMPLRFPTEMSQLQFGTKAIPHSVKKSSVKDWDFVVQSDDVQDYQLRVNKIKDPKKLGIDPDVKQFSGYLDVEEDDKHFFFMAFESRNDPKNDPVILWLNGGPGCSSLTGLFFELGPSFIDEDLKPRYNPYSWTSNATVIFLDQPVNVGYSYSSAPVSNTVAAGKDVYAFLQLFFEQFPEYTQNGQTFHIAGESYAGHYIPVFSTEILSHPERNFNLTSVLIGNGLTDPLTQYPFYEPMACGKGGEPAVLSPEECEAMDDSLERCLSLIESCYESESVWTCVPATIYCNNAELGPYSKSGRNVYDIRKDCDGSDLCYKELEYIDDYLNQDEVKKALGAEVDHYESCNFDINRNFLFAGDWMKPYHKAVTELLNENIPVLIYAGDKDFICNWLGNQAWTDVLPWKHQEEYAAEPIRSWTASITGEKAGEVKSYDLLTFLRVYGAGHMTPMDQSESALSMLNEWIHGNYSL